MASIDKAATVARLMEQMQAHLPIAVFLSPELKRTLRQGGLKINVGSHTVKRVFYLGDEGGISVT